MPATIDQLLSRSTLLWKPGQRRVPARTGLPTGYPALNAVLRESGWPRGALVELLTAQPGAGEMRLLVPVLAALSGSGLYQLWIDPPFEPFAPGLALQAVDLERLVVVRPANHLQWLWATEQSLRSPGCGAVVCWSGSGASRYAELRKLQVAAAERGCLGFLFGHPRHASDASPAALRLQLSAALTGMAIEVLKQRGGQAGQRLILETPAALRRQPRLRERAAIVSSGRAPLGRSRKPAFPIPPVAPPLLETWR